MSDYNPRANLSSADFADTGLWRLIIYISLKGMSAYLKHTSDKSRPMAKMLSESWHSSDPESLLKNIENAVYDHPVLLDDFATEIILETPHTTFVPNEIIDEEDDAEFSVYTALFPGGDPEIIADRLPDYTALFSLTRGLDGFIARTMPGSRIRSHLAVIAERMRRQSAPGPRVYLDIRNGEVDILLFRDSTLLSASVQKWRTPEDIAYRILNLLNAYGISPKDASIFLSGPVETRNLLSEILRNFTPEISRMILPFNPGEETDMPLAALLQAFREG
ncbi:MAG: DUF3822 family protein [Muribaculaceae bacterium]|nr:DUF3822 family protein [Muribaculaceae bacterium]